MKEKMKGTSDTNELYLLQTGGAEECNKIRVCKEDMLDSESEAWNIS